jgi:deoxyribodipyrimidine photo-lyase
MQAVPRTTREEAMARIDALDLARYTRTRNNLDGQVSHLSPYLTHGVLTVRDVIARIAARPPAATTTATAITTTTATATTTVTLGWDEKFIFELGWREYFQHVWRMLGDEIWQAPRATPALQYSETMPPDILTATTGVAVIDQSIWTLYDSGYLHNHARMWLAAYIVHIRKIDWRSGARWMYSYLLDGDLASNTLSWQWVAGTWTGIPYVFNAENVEKYAPGLQHQGSAIDGTYEKMEAIARNGTAMMESPTRRANLQRCTLPALLNRSDVVALAQKIGLNIVSDIPENFAGTLIHPWALRPHLGKAPCVGILLSDFHKTFPWSAARWQFVLSAMYECSTDICIADNAAGMNLPKANIAATHYPIYKSLTDSLRAQGANVMAAMPAFIDPATLQKSFSSYWHHAKKGPFPL